MKFRLNKQNLLRYSAVFLLSIILFGTFQSYQAKAFSVGSTGCVAEHNDDDTYMRIVATDTVGGMLQIRFTADWNTGNWQPSIRSYQSNCTTNTLTTGGSVGFDAGDEFGWKQTSSTTWSAGNFTTNSFGALTFTVSGTPTDYAGGLVFGGYTPNTGQPHSLSSNSSSIQYPISQQFLEFQNPPFSENFTSTNFKKWEVCLSLSDNEAYSGYSYNIEYSTVSANDFGNTDSSEHYTLFPNLTYDHVCTLLDKSVDLTPDTYEARANMYDQSGTLVTTTPILHFTIVAGADVLTPSVTSANDKQTALTNCEIGGGIIDSAYSVGCKLFINLFYPSVPLATRIQTTQALAITKAPFSYFSQGYDIITGLSGSTGTVPTLTYTLSVQHTNDLSVTMFSPTTISDYAGSGGVATFRAIAEVALYLAFIAFVIYEARKLFNPHQH